MDKIIKFGTETSRALNHALGDRTGRTVTRTVMEGANHLTNGGINLSGQEAHVIMIAGAALLNSRDKDLKNIGGVMWGLTALAYLAGR